MLRSITRMTEGRNETGHSLQNSVTIEMRISFTGSLHCLSVRLSENHQVEMVARKKNTVYTSRYSSCLAPPPTTAHGDSSHALSLVNHRNRGGKFAKFTRAPAINARWTVLNEPEFLPSFMINDLLEGLDIVLYRALSRFQPCLLAITTLGQQSLASRPLLSFNSRITMQLWLTTIWRYLGESFPEINATRTVYNIRPTDKRRSLYVVDRSFTRESISGNQVAVESLLVNR